MLHPHLTHTCVRSAPQVSGPAFTKKAAGLSCAARRAGRATLYPKEGSPLFNDEPSRRGRPKWGRSERVHSYAPDLIVAFIIGPKWRHCISRYEACLYGRASCATLLPSHGENTGSSPVGVTSKFNALAISNSKSSNISAIYAYGGC